MNILYGVARHPSPYPEDEIYAGRLAANLWPLGCRGELGDLEQTDFVISVFGKQPCHLLHSFNAVRSGTKAMLHATSSRIPYILTCTGPDLLLGMKNATQREQIFEVVSAADHIVLPFSALQSSLDELEPLKRNASIIPKGVHAPRSSTVIDRQAFGISPTEDVVLLIGDIEPTKNQMFALSHLRPVHADFPAMRVVLLGDIVDPVYGKRVREFADRSPWVTLVPMPDREHLPAWYAQATLVINVSHVEGGYQPFLEAMAVGVPAVAAEIPGNWAFIRSEKLHPGRGTGLLFSSAPSPEGDRRVHDIDEFQQAVARLLEDAALRKAIGSRACLHLRAHHRPQLEAFLHLKLYESILAQR